MRELARLGDPNLSKRRSSPSTSDSMLTKVKKGRKSKNSKFSSQIARERTAAAEQRRVAQASDNEGTAMLDPLIL